MYSKHEFKMFNGMFGNSAIWKAGIGDAKNAGIDDATQTTNVVFSMLKEHLAYRILSYFVSSVVADCHC